MSCTQTDAGEVVYVSVHQGDTLRLGVDLDAATGDVDVTDWTWAAPLQPADPVASLTVTPVDLPTGRIELSLTPTQTATLALADYDWQLDATDTLDDTRTLVVGRLRVRS